MEVDSELIVGLKISSVFNTKLLKDWGLFVQYKMLIRVGILFGFYVKVIPMFH